MFSSQVPRSRTGSCDGKRTEESRRTSPSGAASGTITTLASCTREGFTFNGSAGAEDDLEGALLTAIPRLERDGSCLAGRANAGDCALDRRFATRTVVARRLRVGFDALVTFFAMCALAFMIDRFVRCSAKMFKTVCMTVAKLPWTPLLGPSSSTGWANRLTAHNRLFDQTNRANSLRFEQMSTCGRQIDLGRKLGLAL